MSLPKLNLPISEFQAPTTKDTLKFRPMKVAEEKILLMAKQSGSPGEAFRRVRQVINNCLVEPYDLTKLALVDINYLFIKLREISIGDKVAITYEDREDEREYTVNVDLGAIEVKWEKTETKIDLPQSDLFISLKLPSNNIYLSPVFEKEELTEDEVLEALVVGCLDKVVQGGKSIDIGALSLPEVVAWVQDLDIKTYQKIKEFIGKLPTIYLKAEYTNSKGTVRSFEYKTLNDFFIYP